MVTFLSDLAGYGIACGRAPFELRIRLWCSGVLTDRLVG